MSFTITDQLQLIIAAAHHRRNSHQPHSLPTQEATHARPS
jgi:hypothetical protein